MSTCGFCGWRDENLGFGTTFRCHDCHDCDLVIDRDVQGARNNGLQALANGGFGRPTNYFYNEQLVYVQSTSHLANYGARQVAERTTRVDPDEASEKREP